MFKDVDCQTYHSVYLTEVGHSTILELESGSPSPTRERSNAKVPFIFIYTDQFYR